VSGAQLRNAISAPSNFGFGFALTNTPAKAGEPHRDVSGDIIRVLGALGTVASEIHACEIRACERYIPRYGSTRYISIRCRCKPVRYMPATDHAYDRYIYEI
jgi:hypothetical protein